MSSACPSTPELEDLVGVRIHREPDHSTEAVERAVANCDQSDVTGEEAVRDLAVEHDGEQARRRVDPVEIAEILQGRVVGAGLQVHLRAVGVYRPLRSCVMEDRLAARASGRLTDGVSADLRLTMGALAGRVTEAAHPRPGRIDRSARL
jgi:hypothetical protein